MALKTRLLTPAEADAIMGGMDPKRTIVFSVTSGGNMAEYQPIETAPKDGTKFVSQDRVNYGDREFEGTHWYVHQSVTGWNTDDLDCGDYEWEPTHWRPA